jgi:predicted RNase H-like nuclease (RuvC/YqgF family)
MTNKKKKHCKLWYSWGYVQIAGTALLVCGIYLLLVNPAISSSTAGATPSKPIDPATTATAVATCLSVVAAFYTTWTARKHQASTGDLEQKKFSFEIQVKNWEQLEKMNQSLQERVVDLEKEVARLDNIIENKTEKIQQLQSEIFELRTQLGHIQKKV